MSRRGKREDEPTLFDLPLDGPAEPPEERSVPAPTRAEPAELPWAEDERPASDAGWSAEEAEEDLLVDAPAPPTRPAPGAAQAAPLSVRFLAGLADLAIHLALAVVLLFGARLLGVAAGLGDWPPIALFLLIFSFLYTVLPLAFWGQTPGMAWAGVEARAADGQGLTVGQTVRRWLGGLLTVALVGLPVLFALVDGRSLADRLSDSESFIAD